MKYLNTLVLFVFFMSPGWAQFNLPDATEDVEGLGKFERIQRLEKIVSGLQAQVQKLAAGPGTASGGSGAAKSTFVQFSDLLQVKSEIKTGLEREVGQLKISLARSRQSIESIEKSVDRLKEGAVKDIEFKLTALQKSFEALEKSLRAESSN